MNTRSQWKGIELQLQPDHPSSVDQQVVDSWNNLPEDVVTATSVNVCKNRVDRCNEWDNWKASAYKARLVCDQL